MVFLGGYDCGAGDFLGFLQIRDEGCGIMVLL